MKNTNNNTIIYYDENADLYFQNTVSVDMDKAYNCFEKYVSPKGKVVDIGAGSGRDIKHFRNKGYSVQGIDASAELCKRASAYTGIDVECMLIENWNPQIQYDGVWANASLVHLPLEEIERFVLKLPDALETSGVAYLSFKCGITTGMDSEGRFFSNVTEDYLFSIVNAVPTIKILELWKSEDNMGRTDFYWINVLIGKNMKLW